MRRLLRLLLLLPVLTALAVEPAGAQQGAIVQGTVRNASTGLPLAGVQVTVVGARLGTVTNDRGRFRIAGVSPGRHVVRAQSLGYRTGERTVAVEAGTPAQLSFSLQETAVQLAELVVTGVVGATPKAKLPFVVEKIDANKIPVQPVSAAAAIQGKVAGASVVQGSGRPGSAPSILLRGPKSINATGRSQEPLYIVDGVIVGVNSSIADLPASDIESVEVIKGAAAASLYGSRAANGVVQIRTRRGSPGGASTRYVLRTELGTSDLERSIHIAQYHHYQLTPDGSQFVDSKGNAFNWLDGGNDMTLRSQPVNTGTTPWNTFQDQPWPGQIYDQVSRFFDPGEFLQSYLAVEGHSGGTRYHISFNNQREAGVLLGQPGLNRNSVRLNVDQGIGDNLQLSASSFFSRGSEGSMSYAGPFFTLTRMPAGVDLMAKDPATGELIVNPAQTGENANPVYELLNHQPTGERGRFMGSANLRYSPLLWLDLDANLSYDRLGRQSHDYYKKGYLTARASSLNGGYVEEYNETVEALNGSATATVRKSFSSVDSRLQLRYLMEQQSSEDATGFGYNLVAADVPSLYNTRDSRTPRSSSEDIRAEGYFAIGNVSIKDRYVIDGLVRRDGSSLFGANQRWHTYYRGALAWRLSEEPFWGALKGPLAEFKLRASLGTAGGRPSFAAQYETYSVGDGGQLTPVALGNTDLKPEYAIERELGVDFTTLDRFTVGITYANSEVRDQILRVPLPAYTGFTEQWRNAGTLQSNTWEASLDLPILRQRSVTWSARFLYDRTRQEITQFDLAPYQYGFPSQQGLEDVFYARKGEKLGTFYGTRWATSCADLPQGIDCSQFQKNDQGYFVWVGSGNTWRSGPGPDGKLGTADDLWGTRGPAVRGAPVYWGVPIEGQDSTGNTFLPIGNTTPKYNFSIANNFGWKNLSAYVLLDASMGFNIYNLPRHWSYFEDYSGDQDQAGKPDNEKKPAGYYGSTGLYYRLSPPNSNFVEDGSFMKLRELSVRYRFGREQLSHVNLLRGFDAISVALIGRNLKTWTKYRGYDPEIGFSGGNGGSAAINRFDGFQYPNFRTLTASVELNF